MNSPIFQTSARIISYLFHPLLILTYMICLLMLVNPFAFGVRELGEGRSGILVLIVFFTTTLIPGIAIFMMKRLDLMPFEGEEERSNRIGPFIASGIFYLWLFVNFNRLPDIPVLFKSAILGAILALFTSFLINIFSRISLHAVGMGGLIGLIVISIPAFGYSNFQFKDGFYSIYSLLFIVIFLAGLVGSARMVLKEHEAGDLIGGYSVGFFTQMIAMQFIF